MPLFSVPAFVNFSNVSSLFRRMNIILSAADATGVAKSDKCPSRFAMDYSVRGINARDRNRVQSLLCVPIRAFCQAEGFNQDQKDCVRLRIIVTLHV